MSAPCLACGHDAEALVGNSWSWFIPLDAESMNLRTVNAGASRFAYAKKRDQWSLILRYHMRLAGLTKAVGFRRLTITRTYHGRQKLLDHDNLVGGCKMIVDNLVKLGALVDDNAKGAQVSYRQERATPTGIRFLVEELV